MNDEWCENCRFWLRLDPEKFPDKEGGLCRFNPPVPSPDGLLSMTPLTAPEHWCGKWNGDVVTLQ